MTLVAVYEHRFGPGAVRIGQRDRLVGVSPVKKTRVGPGVFMTTEIDYVTESRGETVARARNVLLMYDGSGA